MIKKKLFLPLILMSFATSVFPSSEQLKESLLELADKVKQNEIFDSLILIGNFESDYTEKAGTLKLSYRSNYSEDGKYILNQTREIHRPLGPDSREGKEINLNSLKLSESIENYFFEVSMKDNRYFVFGRNQYSLSFRTDTITFPKDVESPIISIIVRNYRYIYPYFNTKEEAIIHYGDNFEYRLFEFYSGMPIKKFTAKESLEKDSDYFLKYGTNLENSTSIYTHNLTLEEI